eukprot:Gb_12203 [translate_table: standard]
MNMEPTRSKRDCNEKELGEYDLPGFRFHPTEQELVGFYLKKMVQGKLDDLRIIGVLDLYRYDPCDLPSLARIGEREWFFFVPRDKKVQNGGRPNRITASGYWKATGSDRKVINEQFECIGLKKTLVFYRGRAPRGQKTDWVMNEYRMPEPSSTLQQKPKKDMVVCRVYRKAVSQKSLEERAMNEVEKLNSTDEDLSRYKLTEENIVSARELVTDKKAVKERSIVLPQNCISEPKTEQYEAKQICKLESCCTTPVASDISHSTEIISDGVGYSFGCNGNQSEAMSNSRVCQECLDTTFRTLMENPKNSEGFSSACKSHDILSVVALKDSSSYTYSDTAFQTLWDEKSKLERPKYSMDFCNDAAHIHLISTLENCPWGELWA